MRYPLYHPERAEAPAALGAGEFRSEFPAESQFIEFKSGAGRDQLQETVVAFSNAAGGVILVGVSDDGAIVGRALDAGTEDKVHQVMRDVHNPGRYAIHRVAVDGDEIVAISVARRQEDFAQASSGVVRVRKGTRDEPLFGSELKRIVNERSSRRYELTPTDALIRSADPELLAMLSEAFGWEGASLEERLVEHGYASEGRLTVAGALYLTEDPAKILGKAYLEILRYRDDDSVDYDLRVEIRGALPAQLRQARGRVAEELGTEPVVLGLQRHDLQRVPAVVVREAIANALAHRSYELSRTPVRIELRPSSVHVLSPGGLPEPVTVENIRETTAPRNSAVIAALRRFGLAEDAGRGIDMMENTMLGEMLEPPRIEDRGHQVAVTLPAGSPVAPQERAWIQELEHRGHLEAPDRLLLVHAARGKGLTNAKAREILKTDRHAARRVLQRLRDAGFLRQHGRRGGVTYHLTGSLRPPAGLRLAPDELGDLLVSLAGGGPIGNADVRAVTGLGPHEARALLVKLVKEGRLAKVGERRGTRYRLPAR